MSVSVVFLGDHMSFFELVVTPPRISHPTDVTKNAKIMPMILRTGLITSSMPRAVTPEGAMGRMR